MEPEPISTQTDQENETKDDSINLDRFIDPFDTGFDAKEYTNVYI